MNYRRINKLLVKGFFSNMTKNFKSNTKITHFLFEFFFPIHPKSSRNSRKWNYIFFVSFLENNSFTLSSSSSPSIYNIDIVVNILTTLNNQFEALNAPKFWFLLFISH